MMLAQHHATTFFSHLRTYVQHPTTFISGLVARTYVVAIRRLPGHRVSRGSDFWRLGMYITNWDTSLPTGNVAVHRLSRYAVSTTGLERSQMGASVSIIFATLISDVSYARNTGARSRRKRGGLQGH